ncbi:putative membrane protein [Candidatus Neoehrlichia lotoris str. RAC413]|uniref:Putative membrane protein n=1 Tax=Candidatus Neoehrlichia procyonis str. RAC413 TaxID=1359163 RepID=A0A0F3NL71_9RICK|nr:putative membrane protein [Candidatus Neoehrlichia lotoris str. RAC413]
MCFIASICFCGRGIFLICMVIIVVNDRWCGYLSTGFITYFLLCIMACKKN